MSTVADDIRSGGPARVAWAVTAAVGTCGVALCVTTFSRAMTALLTVAASVGASGQPADAVIGSVPASLVAGAAFAVLQRIAAAKAGGFDILSALWIVLFGGTGAAFIMSGRSASGAAPTLRIIGWTFAVFALAGLAAQLAGYMFEGANARLGPLLGRKPSGGPLYVVLNALGATVGIAAGLAVTSALGF